MVPPVIPYRTFPEFHLGPIPFHTFGLFVGLGILVGSSVFLRDARRRGLDGEALGSLLWWILIGGFVGARLLFVLTHLGDFVDRPWAVVAVWEGGLEFSGAFVVAAALVLWWLRGHREVDGFALSDGVVLGLAVGLVIGRIGCYSVGEHLGGTTTFPLAVHYLGGPTREGPIPVGAHIHNTALYEMLLLIPLIAMLFWMRRLHVAPGWATVTFLSWYGVQRFSTDFLRAYDRTVLGLTGAQYVCVGLVVAGAIVAVRVRGRARSEPQPQVIAMPGRSSGLRSKP
jgi:phosphatidylglycerol:prolipoprotein diacylglycerol transferase